MAIDTKQKRRSSLHSLMPFFTPSVSIDGSMSQADRQESAWAYSGVLAAAEVEEVSAIYSAKEKKTSYRAREVESSYSASEKRTSYRARSDEERT